MPARVQVLEDVLIRLKAWCLIFMTIRETMRYETRAVRRMSRKQFGSLIPT